MTIDTPIPWVMRRFSLDVDDQGAPDDAARWLLGLLREGHADWLRETAGHLAGLVRRPGAGSDDELAIIVATALLRGSSSQAIAEMIESEELHEMKDGEVAESERQLDQDIALFRTRPLIEPYRFVALEPILNGRIEGGRGKSSFTVVATGTGAGGNRAVLGLGTVGGSKGKSWAELLASLSARGLSGVQVVVGEGRPSLRAAVASRLPGAAFQSGRAFTVDQVLGVVPPVAHGMVIGLVASIYSQPSPQHARAQHTRVVEQLRERLPEASATLDAAAPEILAFTKFPVGDWPLIFAGRALTDDAPDTVRVTDVQPNFVVIAPVQSTRSSRAWARADSDPSAGAPENRALRAPSRPAPWKWVRRRLRIARIENLVTLPVNNVHEQAAAATGRLHAWVGTVTVGLVMAAAVVARAINLFNFPRYELDEGTYVSSAWAILNDQITAYPYGYGHPPLGWIQIAAWTRLIGGFFVFGNALNTGRVLMVLYAAGSTLLVYLIAAHLSRRRAVGVLAMVIFAFSPLSLAYQRQVLLDNIAVFWLLLAVYLTFTSRSRMPFIVGAGLSFGFAVLSKETFAIFVPAMVYLLWLNISKYQRLFGLITFTYTVLALGFSLVILALIRGELFPYAWHLPWDHHPHLSMLDTLSVQLRRSQTEGSFIDSWTTWTNGDPVFSALSVGGTIFNLIVGIWRRERLFIALAALSYWALLLRGGVVLPFYVIVLIPLVALNAALAADTLLGLARRFARVELLSAVTVACLAAGIVANDFVHSESILTQQPTSAQTQAMVWIRNHVPHDAVVVVNSYLYMDLRQPGGQGVGDGATYPLAHVYWNVAYDPELHDGLLQNNWDRIDYVVADSEMLHDIETVGGEMTLIRVALQHSVLRLEFRADDNEQLKKDGTSRDQREQQIVISIYQVIHNLPSSSPYGRE